MKNRYDISDLPEGQFEPGSRGQVLRNLLGITSKREMEALETELYIQTLGTCIQRYGLTHRFTAKDLSDIHREWLGNVYSWAGTYRQVNIAKGNFQFASALHIVRLMGDFENDILRIRTPCPDGPPQKVVESLAIVHAEFILIHPFREGNGRLGRILSILMALQAGLPPPGFESIKGQKRQFYFLAVQSAVRKDYQPMRQIFEEVIRKALRNG